MKKCVSVILAAILFTLSFGVTRVYAEDTLNLDTPSYVLMEAKTGKVICEKNSSEELHPASVTKIMTLILIFDALHNGQIKLTDEVTVSAHAAGMGGSQVFLEENEVQTVETLIKCISVASANDASVAMAEHICGTESAFVEKMNERAAGLGMKNTHFVNCCGLDDDMHKMSAMDVALMSRELITKYPEIHNYSTIWMDTITHNTARGSSEFGLSNTNKLIKQYQWATGLKTGSTSLAKCCLSATANKDGTELIAVVMAAPNSKTRFADAISLLNYGFSVCHIYEDEETPKLDVKVSGGIKDKIECEYRDKFSYMFTENYDPASITKTVEYRKNLSAPVKKGECVGQCVYRYKDTVIGSVDIISRENIKKANFGDFFKKLLGEYRI